ncbi:MAG: bifunctional phosphopantothenoylcysteine decarboxylase/phosphopantothenate--cysteine ligase CoaBC [Methanotrichaceae archaeon]|nr:bifunctional phosphopantothenoylcysteine decarboxylase/phosphopantothenate--cysteine ligase CoaBC [Methanotrichaceae archaeon]
MQSGNSLSLNGSLADKQIALGVTGSIAAIRVVDLVRDLARSGAEIHCIMTHAACQIIHPYALEYATTYPVITEITGRIEHVEFCGICGRADLLLIAPATANTIGKMAVGIDDTPVTTFATTALGSNKPVVVVPAMHEAMYNHPAVVKNIQMLRNMGVTVIDPRIEEGKAKIASSQNIILEVERLLGPRDLVGRKILVTSGSTAERIDPIRVLTNRASGKTGVEIAKEVYRRGAETTIVHRFLQDLPFCQIFAESAQEMLHAVLTELNKGYDAFISAAAISDYTLDASHEKIKSGQDLVLKLKPTKKIMKSVRSAYPDMRIVGFKAETFVSEEELIKRATESMKNSNLDIVVANDVGVDGMGTDENRVFIIDRERRKIHATGKKNLIARSIVDALVQIL